MNKPHSLSDFVWAQTTEPCSTIHGKVLVVNIVIELILNLPILAHAVSDTVWVDVISVFTRFQKVYASPSRRSMEFKGTEEQIAYPDIFFTVDNFDEVK